MKESIKTAIVEAVELNSADFNVREALDLLEHILKCEGPRNLQSVRKAFIPSIEQVYDDDLRFSEVKNAFISIFKVEQLFKSLLFHVDPDTYETIEREKKGFLHTINGLSLNPNRCQLDDPPALHVGEPGHIEQLCKVYSLRNEESHESKIRNRKELYDLTDSILVIVLYCVTKHRATFRKLELPVQNYNVSSYMQELIDVFRDKMHKFILLNGEQNLKIADRFIFENRDNYENIDEEDRYKSRKRSNFRRGTINTIRKESVPEKRMIIWGNAGTGKSTTLEYLAYLDAKDYRKNHENKIPVLIPLGLLTDSHQSLIDYICTKTMLGVEELNKLLRMGKINLFFDGVNEIPENENGTLRRMRLLEIQKLINEYPETFIILTNRPEETSVFPKLPVFNLMKMDDEQLDLFLEKNTDNKKTIEIIRHAIMEKPKLKSVVRTPLMMSRLIEIVDVTQIIPDSEGMIIGEFLNNLLRREWTEKKDTRFDIRKANLLLRRIAFQGLEDSSTNAGMTETIVLDYMSQCCIEYNLQVDLLYMLDIFQQLGILKKVDNQYRFLHQAYQDYYVSQEEAAILGS